MRIAGAQPTVWSDPGIIAGRVDHLPAVSPIGIGHIELVLGLLAACRPAPQRILDLGSGSGLLGGAILEEYPEAVAVVLDLDPALFPGLLCPHARRITRFTADLTTLEWDRDLLTAGAFDLILGGPKLEVLSAVRKSALFSKIFRLLPPGGLFLSVETLPSPTRWTGAVPDDLRIRAIFGAALSEAPDATRDAIARAYFAQKTRRKEGVAPLEVHLDWLREAGFINAECYLATGEQVVYGGQRPPQKAAKRRPA